MQKKFNNIAVMLLVVLLSVSLVLAAPALKNSICGQQHSKSGDDTMTCLAYFPKWSYQAENNNCVKFVYGGCHGNDNQFNSQEECEDMCKI